MQNVFIRNTSIPFHDCKYSREAGTAQAGQGEKMLCISYGFQYNIDL